MEPVHYFYAFCIALSIVLFTFIAFLFIWKGKEVVAVSEFTRKR
jgi:hypothetical protein